LAELGSASNFSVQNEYDFQALVAVLVGVGREKVSISKMEA